MSIVSELEDDNGRPVVVVNGKLQGPRKFTGKVQLSLTANTVELSKRLFDKVRIRVAPADL